MGRLLCLAGLLTLAAPAIARADADATTPRAWLHREMVAINTTGDGLEMVPALKPGDGAPRGPVVPKPGDRAAPPPARVEGPPAPIDNWQAFDAAFQTCLQPVDGPEGAQLTLKFALDSKGRLRGKPLASYSHLPGTVAEQKAFVAEALASLAGCLPLPLTTRFGPIVASRPLILKILGPRPKERGA